MGMRLPDPEATEKVANALAAGTPIESACLYGGVSTVEYHQWRDRGQAFQEALTGDSDTPAVLEDVAMEQPYLDFYMRTEEARASMIVQCTTTISKAARAGDWRPAAWMLERVDPDNFGRRQIQHVGPGGGAIKLDVTLVEHNLAESVTAFMDRQQAELEAAEAEADALVPEADIVDEPETGFLSDDDFKDLDDPDL